MTTAEKCPDPIHRGRRAYIRGCRCPGALAAWEAKRTAERTRQAGHCSSRIPSWDPREPNFVGVWLAVDGKLSFSRLESEADRVAVVVELAQTFDLTKVADLLSIGWDQARRLYARRELVAA